VFRVKPSDFDFQKCIGKGSFGEVYLARHKAEDTIYAVKVVSKALIKRKHEERHIMAERDVLVKNTPHPFLVSLQYSFQTLDKLYFVMEFVNGGEVSRLNKPKERVIVYDAVRLSSSFSIIYKKNVNLAKYAYDSMPLK
jgi:RAC serine/threonine-protein kinase